MYFFYKGEKGSRGDKGLQGEKGSQGHKGIPGTCDTKVITALEQFPDFHSMLPLVIVINPFYNKPY